MPLDHRLEQLLVVRPHTLEGFRVILLHETAVADHVGGEDSGETALQPRSPSGGRLANRHAGIHAGTPAREPDPLV